MPETPDSGEIPPLELVIWRHAKFVGRLGNRRYWRGSNVLRVNLAQIANQFFETGGGGREWEEFCLLEVLVTYLHELTHLLSGRGPMCRSHPRWDEVLYPIAESALSEAVS